MQLEKNGRTQWTDKRTNGAVLRIMQEKRSSVMSIEIRRGKMFGHLIRHDSFLASDLEGEIDGKRDRGIPRRSYLCRIREKVIVVSYHIVLMKRGFC